MICTMSQMSNDVVIVGYGGHALVVADALSSSGRKIVGYCDEKENTANPLALRFLGAETDSGAATFLKDHGFLITIGSNKLRAKITGKLIEKGFHAALASVDASALISSRATLGAGTQVQGKVVVNALTTVGKGVILNTGCIVEHECMINDFVHIAPGAVLCGAVKVGSGAFIGANATVNPGVKIGEHAIVGAGTVVLQDVPEGRRMVGNPGRLMPAK